MKLEEVIKYIRSGKKISRPNGRFIKYDTNLETFEETFVLKEEDLFVDDWQVEGFE